LFVGDHHVTGAPYYQNVPIVGRLLAEWGDRPCGALFLLPLWHPVLMAEQVGTLASVARGRFIIQCAIGAGRGQFAAMDADIRKRPSRLRSEPGDRAPSAGGRRARRCPHSAPARGAGRRVDRRVGAPGH